MNRKIGLHETLMWLIELTAPYNLQATVNLTSKITEKALKETLLILQQKHPFLRSCLDTTKKLPEYIDCHKTIPYKIISRQSSSQWGKIADSELKKTTIKPNTPPFRLTWLKGQKYQDLVFTWNHMIIDGQGSSYFINDFLQTLSRVIKNKIEPAVSYPNRRIIEKELGLNHNSNLNLPGSERLKCKQYTASLVHQFSEAETKKIIRFAKTHNTSVHGILCAAHMKAVAAQLSEESTEITAFSPVNLRPYLKLDIDKNELSTYITALPITESIAPNTDFSALAKAIKTELVNMIKQNKHLETITSLKENIKQFDTPKKIIATFQKNRNKTAPISNLGILDTPKKIDDFKINNLTITANLPTLWPTYLSVVYTLHGKLNINFCYTSPRIKKTEAIKFKNAVIKILKEELSKK